MWTGIIVLVVLAVGSLVAWWFTGGAATRPKHSRGGPGVRPGRDYNIY